MSLNTNAKRYFMPADGVIDCNATCDRWKKMLWEIKFIFEPEIIQCFNNIIYIYYKYAKKSESYNGSCFIETLVLQAYIQLAMYVCMYVICLDDTCIKLICKRWS